MNISSIIGLSAASVLLYFSITTSMENYSVLLNHHGIMIVFGGTLAAGSICFKLNEIISLLKIFFLRFIGFRKPRYGQLVETLVEYNRRLFKGEIAQILGEIPKIKDPFLREAMELVLSSNMAEGTLRKVLETRYETTAEHYYREAEYFKTLGRFPPAFGLVGTTLSMIALLQTLGSADAQKGIGPSMAIGLVATFYGVVTANLILIPIGESLKANTKEELLARRIIIEGVLIMKRGSGTTVIKEMLNSYLPPRFRVGNKEKAKKKK